MESEERLVALLFNLGLGRAYKPRRRGSANQPCGRATLFNWLPSNPSWLRSAAAALEPYP